MQINPNVSTGGVGRTPDRTPVSARVSPSVDQVALQQTQAIQGVLQQTPDVRPAAVERAKELVREEAYPPLVTIEAISNLLALSAGEQS